MFNYERRASTCHSLALRPAQFWTEAETDYRMLRTFARPTRVTRRFQREDRMMRRLKGGRKVEIELNNARVT